MAHSLSYPMTKLWKRWLRASLIVTLLVAFVFGTLVSPSNAALPAGNAITDGKALLRYSLPIDNPTVRELQTSLEDIAAQLRANRRWGAIAADLKKATKIVKERSAKLLATVPENRQPQAKTLIDQIQAGIETLQPAVEAKEKNQIWEDRAKLLTLVGQLEELMAVGFPFEVPAEYSNLPQLKGRATVEIATNKGDLTVVLDGYSAPVTAGNFVDLVQRGFYNGLEFTRSEDSYVLQIGDPPGKEEGFIDPDTGKYRAVPLEVLAENDKTPTYGITLEDAGRYRDGVVLPFSAYGTLAMARPESEPNGASSQFFFFLFEPELTPAGRNLLDGRYSVFGYLTEGKEVLEQLKAGDVIKSAKVVAGLENLVEPKVASSK
ncbi:peptidylprolyl isomerase [Synechocystis sp. PCC 7509]|uniref:peptidylprolyl isomerase n=1 Tax=Synechocystis sp. PCC 7509 TaxID=927677 RepID=UPI0002AC0FD0|nr:peptidylprolyl isomerase [Synechocystis sp. PCC 7509]